MGIRPLSGESQGKFVYKSCIPKMHHFRDGAITAWLSNSLDWTRTKRRRTLAARLRRVPNGSARLETPHIVAHVTEGMS
jgi:hypothetical protein